MPVISFPITYSPITYAGVGFIREVARTQKCGGEKWE
jgi:hypothetical protein